MKKEILWKKEELDLPAMNSFCEDYKEFLSSCKTERECTAFM